MQKAINIDTLTENIKAIENVVEVNRWVKGEHDRLYVNVKSQNRFANDSKIYIDLNTGELVSDLKKGQSGAKSYAWAVEVAKKVEAALDMIKAETDNDENEITENDEIGMAESTHTDYIAGKRTYRAVLVTDEMMEQILAPYGRVKQTEEESIILSAIRSNFSWWPRHDEGCYSTLTNEGVVFYSQELQIS